MVNSNYADKKGLKLTAKVLNLDLSEKFSQTTTLDCRPDGTQKVITLARS